MSSTPRRPTDAERRVLDVLGAQHPARALPTNWTDALWVEEMDDGGMGSLKLLPPEAKAERISGRDIGDIWFTDRDGVQVLATLVVDRDGLPFELDIWKTDFSPLIAIPTDLRCPGRAD